MPRRSWVLGAVAWVALGGVARADRKGDAGAAARAEELVQRGLQSRRAGDDQGALPLFKEAYDLSGSARAVTQLGFCHQALGQWLDAETNITEGLKASDDPWIRKNRETITEALRTVKLHIGRLEVAGEPDGAEVAVNGAPVGKLPIPSLVRVEAGDVSIELRAPGYLPATRTVRIGGAQHQKVTIRLERAPVLATASAGGPLPSAAAGGPAPADPRPPSRDVAVKVAVDGGQGIRVVQGGDGAGPGARGDTSDGAGPSTARRSAKWVAWGLSAVGVGLGVYGTVRNGSLVRDFNSGCGFDPDTGHAIPSPGSTRSMAQCTDLAGRYESASHLGIGGFVGAGVFAAAGLILWLTEPAAVEQKRDVARSLTCAPQLTSRLAAGIGCGFAFF